MNELLKLHKTVGGNGLNKLTYREYLDEHFNLGELKGVSVENNKLNFYPIPTFLELNGEDFEDKSLNKHSITKTGNVSIVDTDIGKSYYFNATLGGIDLPQNTITINKTYSIETLVRFKGNPTDYHVIFHQGSSSYDIRLSIPTARTTIDFNYWNGSTTNQGCGSITLPKALDLNVWYKLTFIFVAETLMFKVYLDDVFIGDKKCTSLPTLKSGVQRIGANASSGGYANLEMKYINFYNYDLIAYEPPTEGYRISPPIELPKNIVSSKIDWEGEGNVYQQSLVNNLDPYTVLFLNGDDFENKVNKDMIITQGNTSLNPNGKFGSCLDFSKHNTTISISAKDKPIFGTDDFTIDWWENILSTNKATSGAISILNDIPTSGNTYGIMRNANDGQLTLIFSSTGASWDLVTNTMVTWRRDVPLNTWTHRALVRKGELLYFFTDGKLDKTVNIGNYAFRQDTTTPMYIGGQWRGQSIASSNIGTLIDNFRISKVARWTESFNPYTEDLYYFNYIPLEKGKGLNSLSQTVYLKQEVKGEETISNVKLELKHKPKKEYIRPNDLLNNEEDTNKTYLYKSGDECTSLTGGWGITNSSYNVTTPTYERTDRLRAHIVCGNSNGHHCGFITNKAIDLTPYSKIYFDMSNYHTDEYNRGLINIKSGSSSVASIGSPAYENAPRQIREIDISNINTSCIIQITAETVWNGKQAEVVIYNIWLEK